ncbi:MAG: hypothetical protein QG597_2232 [Actinomycetota bacterium]|nr:hypothetical protein [Actinomycetota bacterium]
MATPGTTDALVVYLGWGIATSPLPLAGLAIMLLSDRARRTASVFTAVWFACQVVAITLFTTGAAALEHLDLSRRDKRDIAVALLVVAVIMCAAGLTMMIRQRRHPKPSAGASTRDFLAKAQRAGAKEAAGMAFATAALNITNVPYWVAIGLVIQRARVTGPDTVALVLLGAVSASLTFLLATVLMFVLGARITPVLRWLRDELGRHSTTVVPGFLLMSGVVLGLLAASDLGWI